MSTLGDCSKNSRMSRASSFFGVDLGGATKEHPPAGAVTRSDAREGKGPLTLPRCPKEFALSKGWDPFFPPGWRQQRGMRQFFNNLLAGHGEANTRARRALSKSRYNGGDPRLPGVDNHRRSVRRGGGR